ncbi:MULTISPECIES: site-specific integrase [Xanthomonas]|uniref:Site-specific integrase n=4 Tax=Xanthomonas TaxID=338 RepID=A0AA44Z1S7_XANCM|nr:MULTISPECIES: site-specific integrase [Xanthomonas]AOL20336.1 integrase [Xanthomonas citri pv. malvacearum]AOY68856.1 integrase [Xanthomonas euvesicatoria pv. vesicatoria str. 85-10]ASN02220.1 recombinase [Xanthomonas citri pv. malvacearum]ASY85418.1 integrase [Xanthomonas citri pv. malvacearum]ASY89621.1 integrase [Xanthomonas citri pv. malvacearum]
MASFRKRDEFQWQARVRRRGYPEQTKTFNTKAEAEAWARKIESEIDRGVFVSRTEAEATSLEEVLDRYEREVVASKKGKVQEQSIIRLWKATTLAKRSMASIRSTDVVAQRDLWLQRCKPATVLRRLALLSHVFNIARREWGMESLSNPVELIRKPQPNNARTRRIALASPVQPTTADESPPDHGELERIIAASGSGVLPAVLRLALETAMRRSEIVGLRWEHIDLAKRVAHLPDTKNGSSRDVPLSSRAVAVLESVLPKASDMSEQDGGEDDDRVFKVSSDAITRAFVRALARARKQYLKECEGRGIKPQKRFLADLRFHDLRHEATSRLAAIFPMHELTKITGHKDPRMLMRYYHPRAEDLAKRLD